VRYRHRSFLILKGENMKFVKVELRSFKIIPICDTCMATLEVKQEALHVANRPPMDHWSCPQCGSSEQAPQGQFPKFIHEPVMIGAPSSQEFDEPVPEPTAQ